MSEPLPFPEDLAAWSVSGDGPWRLSHGDLHLEVRRTDPGLVGVALLWRQPRRLPNRRHGVLLLVEDRRDVVGPTRLPPDPRDGEGAPLHAALAAASLAIGPGAERTEEALTQIAEIWADHLGEETTVLDFLDQDRHQVMLDVRSRQGRRDAIQALAPLCPALARRVLLLGLGADGRRPTVFHAPAAAAHVRAQRRMAAEATLLALGADPLLLPLPGGAAVRTPERPAA